MVIVSFGFLIRPQVLNGLAVFLWTILQLKSVGLDYNRVYNIINLSNTYHLPINV